ncbi:MAG: 50S ribosomal protein L25 [bacterium]
MAVQINIKAKVRDRFGKEASKKSRREGLTPAILYGNREKALPLWFDTNEFLKQVHGEIHENVIFNLKIESASNPQGEDVRAIIKELQFEPKRDTLVHIDFYEMVAGKLISIEVPIEAIGEPRGVKIGGGILEHIKREVLVECLPKAIPDSIKVDITNLDVAGAIHVRDLEAPEGVTLLDDPEGVVFTIVHGMAATTTTAEPASSAATETK